MDSHWRAYGEQLHTTLMCSLDLARDFVGFGRFLAHVGVLAHGFLGSSRIREYFSGLTSLEAVFGLLLLYLSLRALGKQPPISSK